jgi:hypothetical protein
MLAKDMPAERDDSRPRTRFVREGLPSFQLDSLLELSAQLLDFPWLVRSIICQAG